jgi:hypothetical protein
MDFVVFGKIFFLESSIGESMVVLRLKVLVEPLVRQLQFFEKPKSANAVVVLAVQVPEHRVVLVLLVVADSAEEEVEGVVALHYNHNLEEEEQECKVVAVAVSRVVEEDLEEDKVLVAFQVEEVRHRRRVLVDLLRRRLGTVPQVSMVLLGDDDDDDGLLLSSLCCVSMFECASKFYQSIRAKVRRFLTSNFE